MVICACRVFVGCREPTHRLGNEFLVCRSFRTHQRPLHPHLGYSFLFGFGIFVCHGISVGLCGNSAKREMEGFDVGDVAVARVWHLCLYVSFLLQSIIVPIFSYQSSWFDLVGEFDMHDCGVSDC